MKAFASLLLCLMLFVFSGCQSLQSVPPTVQLPATGDLEPVGTVACGEERGEVFDVAERNIRIVVFTKFKTVMVVDFNKELVTLGKFENEKFVMKRQMSLAEAKTQLPDPCSFFVSTEV